VKPRLGGNDYPVMFKGEKSLYQGNEGKKNQCRGKGGGSGEINHLKRQKDREKGRRGEKGQKYSSLRGGACVSSAKPDAKGNPERKRSCGSTNIPGLGENRGDGKGVQFLKCDLILSNGITLKKARRRGTDKSVRKHSIFIGTPGTGRRGDVW